MTLRTRLFLIIGGLAALLVLAQWWWTRKLTRELSDEIGEVASSVGRSVAAFFTEVDVGLIPGGQVWEEETVVETRGEGGPRRQRMVRVFTRSAELGEDREPAGRRRSQPPDQEPAGRQRRRPEDQGPAMRILEFDAGTGNVRLVGDRETPGEDVEVEDLGGGRFAFTFRPPSPAAAAATEVEVSATRKAFVQLHVEHDGDERFLFLGGPHHLTHRFEIPQQGIRQKLDGFSSKLLLASLGILAVGLVLAGAAADRVSAPLRRLAGAAREVGDGALGTRVRGAASGEVGEAITAFNHMSGRLAELEARTRELEARRHLGEIGEIARGLAHSLRNPLNALSLSLEELAAASDGDGEPELALAARRQIRRIDRSIRSFLALASQGGGTAEEVDLAALVEDVALEALQGVRPPGGRGRVRIETDLEPGLTPLQAVEPELRAVVQALVVNAVEASPDGGTVNVRLDPAAGGRVRLEVADEGPGLPEEVRARLFTPHLSTKASGSGMGLFLAHRIAANRYRGRLELVDREAGGTRALLELGARVESPAEDGR